MQAKQVIIIIFCSTKLKKSKIAAQKSHDRSYARKDGRDEKVAQNLWNHYTKGSVDYANDAANYRERLLKLENPVLVVMGDHDVCFPVENWYELNRKLSNTQIITFPRAGHGPQHEHPELVAKYIKEFVNYIK